MGDKPKIEYGMVIEFTVEGGGEPGVGYVVSENQSGELWTVCYYYVKDDDGDFVLTRPEWIDPDNLVCIRAVKDSDGNLVKCPGQKLCPSWKEFKTHAKKAEVVWHA